MDEKTKKFIEQARSIHGYYYDYSNTVYIRSDQHVTVICPFHELFSVTPRSHIRNGKGCPLCKESKAVEERHKKFIDKSTKAHGDKYDYSLVDKSNKLHEKVTIVCPDHGPFSQTKNNHMKGQGCYECSLKKKADRLSEGQADSFVKKAIETHGERYEYSKTSYKSSKENVTITCPTHGDFEQTPNNHLRGAGCPQCGTNTTSQKRIKATKASLESRLRDARGDHYEYDIDSYGSDGYMLTIVCSEHGRFKQTLSNHLKGQSCPICSHLVSVPESELVDFITSLGVQNIVQNDRTIIKPKEVDIYLPDHNIAIEFNGLQFHSERYKADKNYHLSKTDDCEEQGVRLIHIYEDEWNHKKGRVKDFLRAVISPDSLYKRNARSLQLQSVSAEESKEFLDLNHIQGYKRSGVKYGLFENNMMVAYIGLTKHPDGWHIDRFSSVGRVRGGFSKLLSHFKKNHQWDRIISFADRRYSRGNVYKATGFTLESITRPGYDYQKNRNRYNRTYFMKHKLKNKLEYFDPSMTERENMAINGYYRIWNCGMLKFVMTKDD